MRALQYRDIRPFMGSGQSLALKLKNKALKYVCVGYAWGDGIELNIRLPDPPRTLPPETVLNRLILKTTACAQLQNSKLIIPPITEKKSKKGAFTVDATRPRLVTTEEGLLIIEDETDILTISTRVADWIETLVLFANYSSLDR